MLSYAHVGHTQEDFQRGLQTMVSRNKRRFIDSDAKFDLDLTYLSSSFMPYLLPCRLSAPYYPF
jgi:hypothetical protein